MKILRQTVLWLCGIAGAAALVCDGVLPVASLGQQARKSEAQKVEIRLSLPKSNFLIAEDINLTVTVTNVSKSAIEIPNPFHRDNWQPSYTLTGPPYPAGHTFSFRSAALKDPRPEPTGVPPVLVKLAAGEELQRVVPLGEWVRIDAPGSYQIVAKLTWEGLSAQSNVVKFQLQQTQPLSMSVGVDIDAPTSPGDWVEWLHQSGNARELYTALFQRPHVDVRGYDPFSISPLFTAGPQAVDLLSPWTNYSRKSELAKWRTWREGTALFGLVTGLKSPQKLDLGAVPRMLVRPALMTRAGVLDVFVVSPDGINLMLARFPAPEWEGPQHAASILWRLPIPEPVLAGRCALGPESSGSHRHVVLISQESGGLLVSYMDAGNGTKAGHWNAVQIPKAYPIAGSEPGIRVNEDGITDAAVLFETDPASRQLAVVDLRFAPDGKLLAEPKVTPFGRLPAAPKAAAVSYVVSVDGAPRRDWAVLLDNGSLVHSFNPGNPQRLDGTPALPLELVSLASSAYLLAADRTGSPGFTLLK